MAAFAPDQEDDERMKTYVLTRVPPVLRSELDLYLAYRTATFAARRQGGAVQSVSAESDCTSVLRFYGWLDRTDRIPEGAFLHLDLLLRSDLGDIATDYVEFLENQQRIKYSSIANCNRARCPDARPALNVTPTAPTSTDLNGLVSLTTYAYANLEPAESVLNMEPNPLTQVINLRGQAEKASKQQQLYATSKVGGWLSWEDVRGPCPSTLPSLTSSPSHTPHPYTPTYPPT